MKAWLLAFRPKTLTAAIVPIFAATALVQAEGGVWDGAIVFYATLSALFIQIATNLINDAIDFKKGADTSERVGPTRVTASGMISSKNVMFAGFTFLVFAFLLGIPLVFKGGLPIALIGLISLLLAYLYTGGPLPLAYVGLGDIFVVLFFGVIAVGGIYFLHTGTVSLSALILGMQIGFLSTVLIAINNLRDVDQDKKANKKTLAVRFGISFVRREIAFLVFGAFLLQVFWFRLFGYGPGILPVILLPLGYWVVRQVRQEPPSAKYNQYLAKSAALHAGFGLIISIAFFLR